MKKISIALLFIASSAWALEPDAVMPPEWPLAGSQGSIISEQPPSEPVNIPVMRIPVMRSSRNSHELEPDAVMPPEWPLAGGRVSITREQLSLEPVNISVTRKSLSPIEPFLPAHTEGTEMRGERSTPICFRLAGRLGSSIIHFPR